MAKNITGQGREDHRDSESLLSAYLDHSLPEPEREAFEKELAGDPFLSDALEGLKGDDPDRIARSVKKLKTQLRYQLRRSQKEIRRTPLMGEYIYWAIGIILALALAAYLVLQLLRHR